MYWLLFLIVMILAWTSGFFVGAAYGRDKKDE